MTEQPAVYMRIDEASDVLSSLDMLAAAIDRTCEGHPGALKWVLLSAHAVLFGSCICALAQAGHHNVLIDQERCAYLQWQWLEPDERDCVPMPLPTKVAESIKLLKRTRKAKYMRQPIAFTDAELEQAKWLNTRRNDLVHFLPAGFSHEVSALAECLLLVHRFATLLAVPSLFTKPPAVEQAITTRLAGLPSSIERLRCYLEAGGDGQEIVAYRSDGSKVEPPVASPHAAALQADE